MDDAGKNECPVGHDADRRRSASLAIKNTRPDNGAYWVKDPAVAHNILRSKQALQAGAGADLLKFEDPEHAPVFFLDGQEHADKRRKTQRFLSPKMVSEQHFAVMRRVTDSLLAKFRSDGAAKLEDISFQLAIEVVGEILGLTNSDQQARARRIQRVLGTSMDKSAPGIRGVLARYRRALYTGMFFLLDVRPAIRARRKTPKGDAISFYIDEGYSNMAIVIECLTYGTAGMLTTREFIVMAAWYLFEDDALRQKFLAGDAKEQLAILLEIVRLEPVAAMVHRRVNEEVTGLGDKPLPAGEKYGIDIRAANVDESAVGACPFSVDPERATRMGDTGRFLSFADGPHTCPGWLVAMHETRIFLEQLFQVKGLQLVREPDISWNEHLKSYELRNALISCEKSA